MQYNDPASKGYSAEAGSRRPPRRLLLQGPQYHWFAACLPAAVKPPLSPSTVTWRSRAGISRRTGSHLKARGESRSQLVKLNDAGLHHHDEASSTRYPRDAVLRRAQSSLGLGSWPGNRHSWFEPAPRRSLDAVPPNRPRLTTRFASCFFRCRVLTGTAAARCAAHPATRSLGTSSWSASFALARARKIIQVEATNAAVHARQRHERGGVCQRGTVRRINWRLEHRRVVAAGSRA